MANRVFGGSFRGGHWRYLPIRNHDNRSSADWIRLCPGLSKNSENWEQLSKASQGCLSCLKQWAEWSALRLRLLTAIWIPSRRSSRLCKGKLTALEIRMDKESSRGIGMRLLAPRQNKSQSYLFRLPSTSTGLGHGRCWKINPGKSTAVRRSGVPPPFYRHLLITHTHTYTHTDYKLLHIHIHIYAFTSPPRSLASVALNRQPDKRVCD